MLPVMLCVTSIPRSFGCTLHLVPTKLLFPPTCPPTCPGSLCDLLKSMFLRHCGASPPIEGGPREGGPIDGGAMEVGTKEGGPMEGGPIEGRGGGNWRRKLGLYTNILS